jgi:hypothetical protein
VAAGPQPPAVGSNCQPDGKINGAGSTFQANGVNDGFTFGYQQDICGPQQSSTNLNSAYGGTDPSIFTFGTTSVAGMASYNNSLSGTAESNGSGAGLNRMNCRTDFFAGTDLPYNNTQLTNDQSVPGTGVTCSTALNTSTVPPPFGPQSSVGFPNTHDATASMMGFPTAGGAVAYAANLNGACPLPAPPYTTASPMHLTALEFDNMFQGTITRWNDPSLTATNPSATAVSTATDVAQTLPAVTTTDVAQTLPEATLTVTSTTGFPTSGTLEISSSTGTQTLTYTGTTATSFTGVTGGTGSVVAGEPLGAVGTVTLNGSATLPTSGAVTIVGATTTDVLRYTGTTTNATGGTISLTGVVSSANDTVAAGAAVATTSPLAGCSWGEPAGTGNIQRVVRFDNSGTTAITMFTLYGIDQYVSSATGGGDGADLCGTDNSPVPHAVATDVTWYSIATSSNNSTAWPASNAGTGTWPTQDCTDAAGNKALAVTTAGTGGSPALIGKLDTTDGGFGYAETGLWPSPLPAGVSFVQLQSFADEQTTGNTITPGTTGTAPTQNPTPGPTASGAAAFVGPGNAGAKSNCSLPTNVPTGGSAAAAVGLGSPNWSNTGTTTGTVTTPGKQDIAWSAEGAGYPACGLTFDMVYTGAHTQVSGSTTATGGQTLPVTTLQLTSTSGFSNAGTVEVLTSGGLELLQYTGLASVATTCGGTSTACLTGVTGGTAGNTIAAAAPVLGGEVAAPTGGPATPGCTFTTTVPSTTTNGAQTLPETTVTVASTTGFPSSGILNVGGQTVTYTGKTATTFTGAAGGTGAIATGAAVSLLSTQAAGTTTTPGITGACQSASGPLQGATNDQLRTLYSYMTYALSPLAQVSGTYLQPQTLDPLPAPWLTQMTQGYQQNF